MSSEDPLKVNVLSFELCGNGVPCQYRANGFPYRLKICSYNTRISVLEVNMCYYSKSDVQEIVTELKLQSDSLYSKIEELHRK